MATVMAQQHVDAPTIRRKIVDENAGGGGGRGNGRNAEAEGAVQEGAWEKENVHPLTGQLLGYATSTRSVQQQDNKAPPSSAKRRPFGVLSPQPSHDAENRNLQDRSGAVFNKGMKNVDKENRRPLQAAAKSFR